MSVEPISDADFKLELEKVGVTSPEDLPEVPVAGGSGATGVKPVGSREPVAKRPPTLANLATLVTDFEDHAKSLNVAFDRYIVLDLLSSYLSSQFLLFAGPSGTGKSTAAAALQSFFAPFDSRTRIDGRRQMIGPEDLAGYFSSLINEFVPGADLANLAHVARPPGGAASPSILVEEINLSPPEGYLGPLVHGLSSLSAEVVEWRLFADELANEDTGPAVLRFEPYTRLLGTINVDATAMAPARKVAARASVVLLEPIATTDLSPVWELAATTTPKGSPEAKGAPFVGDPAAALRSPDAAPADVQIEALRMAAATEHGGVVFDATWSPASTPVTGVSRRQLVQVLAYISWFDLLNRATAGGGDVRESCRVGAENALLHHVLPTLPPSDFERALENLTTGGNLSSAAPGGLLASRITRLREGIDDALLIGRVLDFWDRLS